MKKYLDEYKKYDKKYIIPKSFYDWAIKEGIIEKDGIFIASESIPDDAIFEIPEEIKYAPYEPVFRFKDL